jgi:cytochrome c biogenesis protein CcmG, thiol:disulfide interchange protein DsbE
MRAGRLAVTAMAVAVLAVAAALALLRVEEGTEASVDLLAAVSQGGPSVAVDSVQLTGTSGSVTLDRQRTEVGRAPDATDLGVLSVPPGRYQSVAMHGGGGAWTAAVDLRLGPGTLQPILLVLDHARMVAYVGNDRVNQGLLLASGLSVPVPPVVLTDQYGQPVAFDSLRGRVTVVAASTTHCHDTCPLYTAVMDDLERVLDARGWRNRVELLSVTMDPWRDTPAVLAAYGRTVGSEGRLLTAPPDTLRYFWGSLHASFRQVPDRGSPGGYDVDHDSLAVVVDQRGDARFWLLGTPRLDGGLAPSLSHLLAPGLSLAALERTASWTLGDLLDRVDVLLGQPAEAARAPEAVARPGWPAPAVSLRALDGQAVSIAGQAGHPVLLSFWATWCAPCRAELPRLAAATRRDPALRLLAVDEGDQADQVRQYLRQVVGPAASLHVLLDADGRVEREYGISGLPVSVFVDPGGTVRAVRVGELDDATLAQALRLVGVTTTSG